MGRAGARRGEMRRRGSERETEGGANRGKWNGRAEMEQKVKAGTRRSMTERNGAEERHSGDGSGRGRGEVATVRR